jgi:hypothetical protein
MNGRLTGACVGVPRKSVLHAVDGRDQEIAKALSTLAAHGDTARLPRKTTTHD